MKSPEPRRAPRKPGRPAATSTVRVTATTIVERGLRLAKTVSVADISIAAVARELGVTPALIHYYLPGGRDALTSGIMNRFYRGVVRTWPEPAQAWMDQVFNVAHHVYDAFAAYPGAAAYFVAHGRFKIFQAVADGDTDYGALTIEAFAGAVRTAPLHAEHAGIYAHLLLEFLAASAHTTARHRWPSDHRRFLTAKLAQLEKADYPHLHAAADSLLFLDGRRAFEEGLRVFIYGMSSADVHLPPAAATRSQHRRKAR